MRPWIPSSSRSWTTTRSAKVLDGLNANRTRSRKAAEVRDIRRRIASARKAEQDTSELDQSLEEAERAVEDAERVQSDILGSDVSLLLPLPGYEAIPSGTVLNHRMFLKNVSDVQLGLFMAGLADSRRTRDSAPPRARLRAGMHGVPVKRIEGASARPVGDLSIDPDRWHDDESSLSLSDSSPAAGRLNASSRRLSDAVTAENVESIAASLRKYGYRGPERPAEVARWLEAQGEDINTPVASAKTSARERRPGQEAFRRALLLGLRRALRHHRMRRGDGPGGGARGRLAIRERCRAGILLRADLHRLFDDGLLVIDRDYTVIAAPPWYRELEGVRLRLPKNRLQWPRL